MRYCFASPNGIQMTSRCNLVEWKSQAHSHFLTAGDDGARQPGCDVPCFLLSGLETSALSARVWEATAISGF